MGSVQPLTSYQRTTEGLHYGHFTPQQEWLAQI